MDPGVAGRDKSTKSPLKATKWFSSLHHLTHPIHTLKEIPKLKSGTIHTQPEMCVLLHTLI